MAQAMAIATLPRESVLQGASTRLAAAAAPPWQHSPSSITWRRRGCSSRGECRLQISNNVGTAQARRSRSQTKLAARADGAAPGDLLTEEDEVVVEDEAVEDETCEIVQGSNVTLGEGQDVVQAYLIQAIKNNNGVGVLCLTDDYGFENEDSRGFAYRLACFGYNVLVPDLFQGEPWSDDLDKSEYEEWQELQSPDRITESIDEATKYLLEEIDTVSGKVVVIGFGSGGGRLIETLARDPDQRFESGVFLYGTGFESSLAPQIKVPLLLIAGDADPLCSAEIVRQIEQDVEGSKAKIYSGLGHGFAHRPSNSEEDEVSEDAFTEIRHWFHDRLLSDSAN